MARIFAITALTTSATLDNKRTGVVSFTVSNTTNFSLRVRLQLIVESPAKEEWLAIEGESTRQFSAGATEQVTVKITVPAGTPEGEYHFRLNAISVKNPDEDFTEGPSVLFAVKPSKAPSKPFPWWIIAVIAGVLLIGSITTWLLLKPSEGIDTEALRQEVQSLQKQYDEAKGDPFNFWCNLRVRHIKKYVDVDSRSKNNGSPVRQWRRLVKDPSQQFKFEPAKTKGYYYIQIRHSEKYLEIKDASKDNGAVLQQWEFREKDNQQFKLLPSERDYYYIQVRHSGKYLSVDPTESFKDGAPIQQWAVRKLSKESNWNQQFMPEPTDLLVNEDVKKIYNELEEKRRQLKEAKAK